MPDSKPSARLFRNARREAILVGVVWFLALTWTVGYCWLHGYQHEPDSWVVQQGLARSRTAQDFQHFGGIPDWVFIGILIPWLICSAFTIGFCLGMKDDDLGTEVEEDASEGGSHGH
ncbi:MAG: hypothetical protein L0Z62_47865 [Gemmataceae bacterium]|nr:hypothetical protein [Gemmataceae bacterium]